MFYRAGCALECARRSQESWEKQVNGHLQMPSVPPCSQTTQPVYSSTTHKGISLWQQWQQNDREEPPTWSGFGPKLSPQFMHALSNVE